MFFEDEHLLGNTDMVEVITEIILEEKRRKEEGRDDWSIPMRPDHGQNILDDHRRNAMTHDAMQNGNVHLLVVWP